MGEAKRRGSFEDRIEQAIEKGFGSDVNLLGMKSCSHFAIVLDHSDEGSAALSTTRQTFDEFNPVWDKFDAGYQFAILVKGKNQKDAGCMLALTKDDLVRDALPAVASKVASVGGVCGFILAVDPQLVSELSGHVESLCKPPR